MTVEIQLPDSLVNFVEAEAAAGGYESPSAYVEELVAREARRREALIRLGELVRAGLESGPAIPMTADDWATIRREGKAASASRTQR